MGKHSKKKSKKHRIEKKTRHKKRKLSSSDSTDSSSEEWVKKRKHSRHKESYSSSDSSSETEWIKKDKRSKSKRNHESADSESSEEQWVEKSEYSSDEKDDLGKDHKRNDKDRDDNRSREDWMTLSTSFFSTSNLDKRKTKDEAKLLEQKKAQYNPQECSRELNPYWKDGGDGLPKFKKPSGDMDHTKEVPYKSLSGSKALCSNSVPNWKKKKIDESGKTQEKNVTVSDIPQETKSEILSEKELNQLAAKLVKAEIMGNSKLVEELKCKLDTARKNRENSTKIENHNEEEVLLSHTNAQGHSVPLRQQIDYENPSSSNSKRKRNVETHKDGERVRYFADDDKYSLKQMFENEKFNTINDQNSEFLKMANKIRKNDDLDDIFSDNIRKKPSDAKVDEKNLSRAISEHQKVEKSLDNCNKCIQSNVMLKHLMVSMGETIFLSLPQFEPLTNGHCFIVPVRHVSCATLLDENEWSEIVDIRKSLVKLFASEDKDVIFFESAMYLHKYPHMHIECIPLPKEEGDMAPIYFKKAIDESETEWAQNKKLVSLKGRDVRKAIPKGLPYFSVSFGMEEGYAHVIEDEQMFPVNFAQEIIGGMLDLHHSKWRKPKKQNFDEQSKRVLDFSAKWQIFDTR